MTAKSLTRELSLQFDHRLTDSRLRELLREGDIDAARSRADHLLTNCYDVPTEQQWKQCRAGTPDIAPYFAVHDLFMATNRYLAVMNRIQAAVEAPLPLDD